jgi:hypothetical protein
MTSPSLPISPPFHLLISHSRWGTGTSHASESQPSSNRILQISVKGDEIVYRPPPRAQRTAPVTSENHRRLIDRGMNTDGEADARSITNTFPLKNILQISKRLSITAIGPNEDSNMDITMKSSSKDDVPNAEVGRGGTEKRREVWKISEVGGAVSEADHNDSEEDSYSIDTFTDAKEEEIGDFKRLPGQSPHTLHGTCKLITS